MKKLFLVAGEISGDSHGADLLKALPDGEFALMGLGGPKMHSQSEQIEDWLDDAAVLGLWEVLKKYNYFKAKMDETVARILEEQPDGVVFIDYPGFNLRLAEQLRRDCYRGKLIYYISPQVWAWKKGRIKLMARLLDLMICIFPFEKQLYEKSGLPTEFCGHPLIDSLAEDSAEQFEREPDLIALLPGSREREIATLFPPMLDAAKLLLAEHPTLKFITTGATPTLNETLRQMVTEQGLQDHIEVIDNASRQIMKRAQLGVVASGTATLEAAILGLPYCLVYKVAWLTAFMARKLIRIKYLGIANVIADREVVKELLQEQAEGSVIAAELNRIYSSTEERERIQTDLARVAQSLGGGGAHKNAATAVLNAFKET